MLHVLVGAVGFTGIAVMSWLAADPPNPWYLAIAGGGILFAIGITIHRYRAGHFG
jgi:hypothetical protein